jgi:hypothetical protein
MLHKKPTEATKELVVNGETYTLFFSFEAIAEAEEATGQPLILGLHKRDIQSPRIAMVRAMLWACMRPYHPKIEFSQAAALVNARNARDIWRTVLDAWIEGMEEQKAETAGDPLQSQS